MPPIRLSLRTASGIAALALAQTLALPAAAQTQSGAQTQAGELPPLPDAAPMSEAELQTLPPEYRSLPADAQSTTSSVDADGVETITRTRRITNRAPTDASIQTPPPYYQPAYAPTYAPAPYARPAYAPAYSYAPVVLDREQWIAECDRRTEGRGKDETGSIIGGLLGAIGGGIAGHELAAAGEALGSTLIGVGVGGIAGILIGSLFDEDDEDRYDCEAALDAYLDKYGENGARLASRTIPARAPVAPGYPAYTAAYDYGYGYSPPPANYYAPQQTMVMVPVTSYRQQRVIVRETVREETVPGAARTIPPAAPVRTPVPQPSTKMIKN